MMKKTFYFIFKALFVLKIFNFFPDFFDHVGKRFDKKANVNFVIYDVTTWKTKLRHILSYCPTSQKVKATRQSNLVS